MDMKHEKYVGEYKKTGIDILWCEDINTLP